MPVAKLRIIFRLKRFLAPNRFLAVTGIRLVFFFIQAEQGVESRNLIHFHCLHLEMSGVFCRKNLVSRNARGDGRHLNIVQAFAVLPAFHSRVVDVHVTCHVQPDACLQESFRHLLSRHPMKVELIASPGFAHQLGSPVIEVRQRIMRISHQNLVPPFGFCRHLLHPGQQESLMLQDIVIAYARTFERLHPILDRTGQIDSPIDSQQPQSLHRLDQITGIRSPYGVAQGVLPVVQHPFTQRLLVIVVLVPVRGERRFPIHILRLRIKPETRIALHLVGISRTTVLAGSTASVGTKEIVFLVLHTVRTDRVVVAGGHEKPHTVTFPVTFEYLPDFLLVYKLTIVGQISRKHHQSDAPSGSVVEGSQQGVIILVEQAGRLHLHFHRTYQLGMVGHTLDMRVRNKSNPLLGNGRQTPSAQKEQSP